MANRGFEGEAMNQGRGYMADMMGRHGDIYGQDIMSRRELGAGQWGSAYGMRNASLEGSRDAARGLFGQDVQSRNQQYMTDNENLTRMLLGADQSQLQRMQMQEASRGSGLADYMNIFNQGEQMYDRRMQDMMMFGSRSEQRGQDYRNQIMQLLMQPRADTMQLATGLQGGGGIQSRQVNPWAQMAMNAGMGAIGSGMGAYMGGGGYSQNNDIFDLGPN